MEKCLPECHMLISKELPILALYVRGPGKQNVPLAMEKDMCDRVKSLPSQHLPDTITKCPPPLPSSRIQSKAP